MRTVTKKIESDGKTRKYPLPDDWKKILGVSVMGASISYELVTEKKKRTLLIKENVDQGKVICAHVVLE